VRATTREISKTAMIWALTYDVHPSRSIILLVVIPAQRSGSKFWGFPLFAGNCASGHKSVLDEKCDLSELCSQLRRKLDEYDIDKINVRYKLVFGSPGDAQAQASWVVLDKDLKHEEKLGRMRGTVIVGSQQNNRSSQSLVSCRVKVSIADSMIEMFVRGRCWSLTPTQGWIDNKLSCMELGVGQHMCVGQGRSYKFSYICSVLIVARLMVVQLHWPKENQPRPPPWPLFHTKQDGQGFSPAKTFCQGCSSIG
jgi:hypothetical protein